MIQATLQAPPAELQKLNRDIERFIGETGRDSGSVLKQQAGLLVRDLMRATPPFAGNAFSESFNAQRRAGLRAVENDVRKVFVPLRVFVEQVANRNPELALALSLAGGLSSVNIVSRRQGFKKSGVDMQALTAIFRNMGMDGQVIRTVEPSLHENQRNNRGRVKRPTRYIVVEERSIDQYVREVQSRVGKAKAGWLKAAIALGVKGIPNWIRNHLVPGVFTEKTGSEHSITVGNLVDYGADFNPRQFQAAIENRSRSMNIQLQKILEATIRKHQR